MLKTKDLIKIYANRKVVNKVGLAISPGEIVGLLGPNGAGKTTTFYSMVGIIKPNSGNILLKEKDITKLPMYKRAHLGIGYLSQEPSIFRKLSVEDNIRLILQMQRMSKNLQQKILEEILEEFHISHLRKNIGSTLSGGERRRVEIARCLCTSPQFLLLDEPFTGIDPITIDDLQKMIIYLKDKNIGILITDHNVRDTLSIVDRAYIIHQGEILVEGTAKEVASSEIARKFYLGEDFSI